MRTIKVKTCFTKTNIYFHWANALFITLLVLSGLWLHWPTYFPVFPLRWAKWTHSLSAMAFTFNFLAYMYYLIAKGLLINWIFRWGDLKRIPGFFAYVFFLKKEYYQPPEDKYNTGQKLVYSSWIMVSILSIITGFSLYFLDNLIDLTAYGSRGQSLRYIHYLLTLYWIITIPTHIYLSLTEDPARLQSIFTGKLREE